MSVRAPVELAEAMVLVGAVSVALGPSAGTKAAPPSPDPVHAGGRHPAATVSQPGPRRPHPGRLAQLPGLGRPLGTVVRTIRQGGTVLEVCAGPERQLTLDWTRHKRTFRLTALTAAPSGGDPLDLAECLGCGGQSGTPSLAIVVPVASGPSLRCFDT
jgi:hypothetical protein